MWPFCKTENKIHKWRRVLPTIDSGKIFYKVMEYEADDYAYYSEKCLDIFESKAIADAFSKLGQ